MCISGFRISNTLRYTKLRTKGTDTLPFLLSKGLMERTNPFIVNPINQTLLRYLKVRDVSTYPSTPDITVTRLLRATPSDLFVHEIPLGVTDEVSYQELVRKTVRTRGEMFPPPGHEEFRGFRERVEVFGFSLNSVVSIIRFPWNFCPTKTRVVDSVVRPGSRHSYDSTLSQFLRGFSPHSQS